MRVVLDTNILISACWTPGGNESQVVAMALGGRLIACVSATVEAEYRDVAQRKKFARYRDEMEEMIDALLAVCERVEPEGVCTACSDADDNHVMDCALAGRAEYVVTGNLRHFPEEWRGVRATNARGLLQLGLGGQPGC